MMADDVDPFEMFRSNSRDGKSGSAPAVGGDEPKQDDPSEDERGYPKCGTNPVDVEGQQVDLYHVPEYNWEEAPWEPQTVLVRSAADEKGRWRAELTWAAPLLAPGAVAVYRVLVGDGFEPDEDCSDVETTLLLTTECEAVDAAWINEPEAPVRFYEVWCYSGDSVERAVTSSPYPVGSCHLIWPVSGLTAEMDHGQVVLSWDGGEDPSRQFRLLRQDPKQARAERVPRPEEGEVVAGSSFVDQDVEPGQKYVYTVYAGTDVNGQLEWSRPARRSVKVPGELRPVLDLAILPSGDGNSVDLCWTRIPGAEVRVYRSETRPALAAEEVGTIGPAELAARVMLQESDRLRYRPTYEGDRAWLRDVAIPPASTELHFTPVTSADHKCAPGRTQDWLRLRPPTDPFVEDRVDWILIVFEWPVGAADVLLYVSEVGQDIVASALTPLDRISHDDHRVFGGFRVDRSRFKAGTCDLHLAAGRFSGHAHFSETVRVTHSFPAMVHYRIATESKFRGSRTLLSIVADEDVRDAEFRLAWNSHFLPLSGADCERVLLKKILNLRRRDPYTIDLSEQVPDLPEDGFIRLLSRPTLPIAVIDPPIDQLRL